MFYLIILMLYVFCFFLAIFAIKHGRIGKVISETDAYSETGQRLKKLSFIHFLSGIILVIITAFYLLTMLWGELAFQLMVFQIYIKSIAWIVAAIQFLLPVCLLAVGISGLKMEGDYGRYKKVFNITAIIIGIVFVIYLIFFFIFPLLGISLH